MQLSLTSPPSPGMAAPTAAAGRVRPSRDAAMAQLDRIAAAGMPRRSEGLGVPAVVLALLGGVVVLAGASMWRGGNAEPRLVAAPAVPAPAAPAVASTAPARAVIAPAATAPVEATAAPTATAAPAQGPAESTATAPADEAARQARLRQAAEARRKAAQLAQERAAADETRRLQLAAQQREADQAARRQAEQAADRAADRAPAPTLLLAAATRHASVRETCAQGGLLGEMSCRARECAKAEHQGDALCVRLRDAEEVQRRASLDR